MENINKKEIKALEECEMGRSGRYYISGDTIWEGARVSGTALAVCSHCIPLQDDPLLPTSFLAR
jgi:hypothetical protein